MLINLTPRSPFCLEAESLEIKETQPRRNPAPGYGEMQLAGGESAGAVRHSAKPNRAGVEPQQRGRGTH